MNRAAPVLAILLGLAGCDGKQLDSIPRSMSAPDLERAAGKIACNAQQNLEQKSDIAIRGTENVVVATGLLSERDIADTKAQIEMVGREPIAAARNFAGANIGQMVDCQTVGRQVVELGTLAAKLAR
jgi:hypothetical protein